MHEMSIAMSIIEAVVEKASQENSRKVSEIELQVGKASGILTESLTFCFSAAAKNTIVDGARLEIRETESLVTCEDCGNSFPVEGFFAACPSCGSYKTDLVSGRELLIKSITLEDE